MWQKQQRQAVALTGKVRTGLVRAGRGAGRLPAGDVDGFEVLGHLRDLYGVEPARGMQSCHARSVRYADSRSVCVRGRPPLRVLGEGGPELLCL